MEPGCALQSVGVQVYIDDPDVANASKENISVSFLVSSRGNEGWWSVSRWPVMQPRRFAATMAQAQQSVLTILLANGHVTTQSWSTWPWISCLIDHVIVRSLVHVNQIARHQPVQPVQPVPPRHGWSMQQGSACGPIPSGSNLRILSCKDGRTPEGAPRPRGHRVVPHIAS